MLNTRLDRATARAAIAVANRAPSLHNSQPWRWRIGDTSIHMFADTQRELPVTDPTGRDLRISCGAALHHLRVALRAAGLDAHVHRLPDAAAPRHLAAVEPFPRRPTDDDLALAAAVERRRSDRRMFSTWPVDVGLLDELRHAAEHEGAELRVLEQENQRLAVARLVERAAVEQAFVPDLAQLSAGQGVRLLHMTDDRVGIRVFQHDPVGQKLRTRHVVFREGGSQVFPVEVRYCWPSELDLMARLAGLRLRSRWADWRRGEFDAKSEKHVSVYERPPL